MLRILVCRTGWTDLRGHISRSVSIILRSHDLPEQIKSKLKRFRQTFAHLKCTGVLKSSRGVTRCPTVQCRVQLYLCTCIRRGQRHQYCKCGNTVIKMHHFVLSLPLEFISEGNKWIAVYLVHSNAAKYSHYQYVQSLLSSNPTNW